MKIFYLIFLLVIIIIIIIIITIIVLTVIIYYQDQTHNWQNHRHTDRQTDGQRTNQI